MENRKKTANSTSRWSWPESTFLVYIWGNWGLERGSGLHSRADSWENHLLSLSPLPHLPLPSSWVSSRGQAGWKPYQDGSGQVCNTGVAWVREGKVFKISAFLLEISLRATDRQGVWGAAPLGRHPGERKLAGSWYRVGGVIACRARGSWSQPEGADTLHNLPLSLAPQICASLQNCKCVLHTLYFVLSMRLQRQEMQALAFALFPLPPGLQN